ncbi:MAG: family peptidase, partial [Firmicutes bacterium]|nr:family peptidase [Bacillota bacterium]
RERYTEDVRRITTLPFQENGVGIIGDKFDQIAVIELDGVQQPRILTKGDFDHARPAWSPDGRHIAFAISRWQPSETADPERMQIGDIGLIPAEGGAVRRLTKSVGPAYNPAFAPDGRTIAYIGHARQHGDYTQPSLWLVGVQGGDPRDLTARFDRPLGDESIGDMVGQGQVTPLPAWAPDGRSVYYLVSDSGMTHLVRIATDSGTVAPVAEGQRVIYSFSLSPDGRRAAICHTDPLTPGDVSVLELGRSVRERRLTEVNRALLSGMALATPERYTFPSGDATAEGWILRPPERRTAGNTPAVLEIHGGPMVMYGYRFFFEFQLLAASGITVVYANPRGSMGYGQAFVAAIRGDWGNRDFQDVMNAIDAAVKRGGIDTSRLGIAGGSYGGFMVNWAIGHTDRFKAAIAMRSISNQYSMFGTSDFGFADLADFGGPPWRMPDVYRKQSPISYVEQVKTPLLMIHSEQDLRTPISEAEQFYTALKLLGRDVTLLRYPDENHELSRTGQPWHRVHRLEAIVRWFGRRLGGEGL